MTGRQDHTLFAVRAFAISPQGSTASCTWRSKYRRDELHSAAHPHVATGSQGLPALPAPLMPTLPRPPQARLAIKTTTRSPLKDKPGWAIHTPFPNFGKVEYFCGEGLTGWRNRGGAALHPYWDLLVVPIGIHRIVAAWD